MRRAEREVAGVAALAGLLDRAAYATLSFLDSGAPAAVPVSFGYRVEGGIFVFYIHSAGEGHKMECLQNDPRAVLSAVGDNRIVLAEPACRSTCFYESVIASGEVEFVTAPEEKRAALDCIMHHCGGAGAYDYPEAMLERTAILRLSARSISGKSNIAEMKR